MTSLATTLTKTTNQKIGGFKTQYTLHDKAQCSMPGLFTSFKRPKPLQMAANDPHPLFVQIGSQKSYIPQIDPSDFKDEPHYGVNSYRHGDVEISVSGVRLGVLEGRILQILIAIASMKKEKKEVKDHLSEGECLYIPSVKVSDICRELGIYDNGRNRQMVRNSLFRMKCAVLSYRVITDSHINKSGSLVEKSTRTITSVIHQLELHERDVTLSSGEKLNFFTEFGVLLNRRITDVILGNNPTGYTRIELYESRNLSDPAWAIHQRLCSFVDAGKQSFPIGIDKLCEYAWGEPDIDTPTSVITSRRYNVKKLVAEFESINWKVIHTNKNFVFTRPSSNLKVLEAGCDKT